MMQPKTQSALTTHALPDSESGINVAELIPILRRNKLFFFSAATIGAVIAGIALHFIPDSFSAQALIMPPQQQQSSLAALASGALAPLAATGAAAQLGLKNPADLYIGILKSRTISDAIIARFHLMDIYGVRFASDAREMLAKHASFTGRRDTLLAISVEDHDPRRAAEMANAFIDELYKVNSALAVTDASQRRLFFQQRLAKESTDLSEAEGAFKNVQTATGLVAPGGQAEALIRGAAELRAQIATKQVSLQAVRSYATEENPGVKILKQEISAMQSQLAELEGRKHKDNSQELSAGSLPSASLEYLRRLRDLKYHEALYELLSKQYEAALMDEAKQAPVIQVVDRAVTPDKKSGPARAGIASLCGCIAAILAGLYQWSRDGRGRSPKCLETIAESIAAR